VHPNNPTGSFLKRSELDALAAIAVEHGLALISDEVFGDYSFGEDPTRVPSLVNESRALTFCLSGLSKVVGLPQLKLGWIHVSGPRELRALAEERLELIADTYLSVGAPVQHAAAALLDGGATLRRQIAARTVENHRMVGEMVRGTACQLLHAEGGWYATLRVPRTRTEEQWVLDLVSDGVLVQPGWFFDFEDEAHLVLSLLTPKTRLQAGLTRLLARVDST
jgi:aspartate/methionine/tyrosine aminotransferase